MINISWIPAWPVFETLVLGSINCSSNHPQPFFIPTFTERAFQMPFVFDP